MPAIARSMANATVARRLSDGYRAGLLTRKAPPVGVRPGLLTTVRQGGDRHGLEDHRFFDVSFPLGWSEIPRVTMPP